MKDGGCDADRERANHGERREGGDRMRETVRLSGCHCEVNVNVNHVDCVHKTHFGKHFDLAANKSCMQSMRKDVGVCCGCTCWAGGSPERQR